jgi:adenosylcobinamide kinase / adenosylcobinamide-phosphate guanylyltransferase
MPGAHDCQPWWHRCARRRALGLGESMGRITLITGGARSGKSAHALKLAGAARASHPVFVATGEALDDEMAARIAHHKQSRPAEFRTVEEPVNLATMVDTRDNLRDADLVIIDCLTLWVSNLMRVYAASDALLLEAQALARALKRAPFASIVVTDEVGAGIVPDNPAARRFRDWLGWINQEIAAVADEVILMVAGLPLKVR